MSRIFVLYNTLLVLWRTRQRGLSLIETIVTVAIFGIVMIAVSSSLFYFYRSNSYSIEQSEAVNSGRRGIEHFVKDAREATYGENGSYPIVSMANNEFVFYSDVDDTDDVERVRYFLDTVYLKKGVIKATGNPLQYTGSETVSTISEHIRNIDKGVNAFTYFNASSTAITDLANTQELRSVRITLVANVNPYRLPEEFTITGTATLRNLLGE